MLSDWRPRLLPAPAALRRPPQRPKQPPAAAKPGDSARPRGCLWAGGGCACWQARRLAASLRFQLRQAANRGGGKGSSKGLWFFGTPGALLLWQWPAISQLAGQHSASFSFCRRLPALPAAAARSPGLAGSSTQQSFAQVGYDCVLLLAQLAQAVRLLLQLLQRLRLQPAWSGAGGTARSPLNRAAHHPPSQSHG